jgi:hypothetical protein
VTKLVSLLSAIARYMPTVIFAALPTSIFVDPAFAPPVILTGVYETEPEPILTTAPPPPPIAFRIVLSAPAPRRVTFDGISIVPSML